MNTVKLTTILFDLDGTLLPMDQDRFIRQYFSSLTQKLAPYGYAAEELIGNIWKGTAAMIRNDGGCRNEEIFWKVFRDTYGEKVLDQIPVFDNFYREEFQNIRTFCGFDPRAAQTVRKFRENGYTVALATNPVFPRIATESRIRWAGMVPEDFALITTYENSVHCKPNPLYYADIARTLGVRPEECLMVGNDVTEDMVASKTGMRVFLLTDCLINNEGREIESFPHGSYPELTEYVRSEEV